MAIIPEQLSRYIQQEDERERARGMLFPEGMATTREGMTGEGVTAGDLVDVYQGIGTSLLPVDAAQAFGRGDVLGGVGETVEYLAEFTPFPAAYRTGEALLKGDYETAALESLGVIPMGGKVFGGAAIRGGDKLSINNDDSLIVQHNLNLETLDELEAIGALPNPSMAITKADMPLQGFGDVTLLGTPDMAKPSARNPVYRADAYTARRPNIETVDPVTNEKINPRFYNQYKYRYEEATPENLSRYMRGSSGEEAMGLVAGKARALAARPFKTFKEVKDARNKIISGYDEVQVKKDFSNTFANLEDSVFEDMKNNVPAFKGKDTLNNMQIDSIRYDLEDLVSGKFDPEVMELLSEKTKKQLFDFHETVQDLPASYFEVNPQRPVELREFANVLVPEGTSKQDILKLERLGANKITTYKDGADKVNKIKGTKEALFVATPAFILAQQLMEQDEEADLLEEDLYKRLGMDDF